MSNKADEFNSSDSSATGQGAAGYAGSQSQTGQGSSAQGETQTGEQSSQQAGSTGPGFGGAEAAGQQDYDFEDSGTINTSGQMSLEQALEKLDEAEATIARQQEDVLRVQAEMQNLRRRTEQDIEKAHKYGQERFSSALLEVIDNLERALQAVGEREDEHLRALAEGVELTLKSFLDCFRKFNIEQVDPLGEPFDPQLHQAVVMQESAEAEPETVLSVMQKGYTLHGRVIRPAMVVVSRAPSPGIDEKA